MTKHLAFMALLACLASLPVQSKSLSGTAGPYRVVFSLRPYPPVVGDHRARLKLTGLDGKPVSGARVNVQTDMPGMPMGVRPFPLAETGSGLYEGTVTLSMQGLWSFVIRIDGIQGLQKIEFRAQTRTGGIPRWLLVTLLLVFLGALAWLLLRFSSFILSRAVLVPLLILVGISLTTFLATRLFLKKPTLHMMGMKMEMAAPDMGMQMRLLSAPKAVAVEPARRESLTQKVTYTGSVAAALEEVVYPRVAGWLLEMPLYPGDRVSAGQQVGKLDRLELGSRAHEAFQTFQAATHDVTIATKELEEAKYKERQAAQELEKARADLGYWKNEFPREEMLLKEGAISKEEYDKEQSAHQAALAELEARKMAYQAAIKARETAHHTISHRQALQAGAGAAYNTARTIEDYAALRAHISGVVTERMVNQGVLVQPGGGIIKIGDIRHVRIQAHVAEKDLAEIKRGTPVFIRSPKLPGRMLKARVTSLFHAVEPESRTGTVEAYIENPGEALFPGDYAEIDFVLKKQANVLTVPKRALIPFRGGYAVWVVKDGLARRKRVIPGMTDGERIEIRQGLKEGETVIFAGQEGLVPEEPVKEAAWGSGSFREILLPHEILDKEEE